MKGTSSLSLILLSIIDHAEAFALHHFKHSGTRSATQSPTSLFYTGKSENKDGFATPFYGKLKMDDRIIGMPLSYFEDAFEDAIIPRPELGPHEIPSLLMKAMEMFNFPHNDAGFISLWEFHTSGMHRTFDNDIYKFMSHSKSVADHAPCSFYGMAPVAARLEFSPVNHVGGENGWVATQMMTATLNDGRARKFRWVMKKRRGPPNQNFWYVDSIDSSDENGMFHIE
mmetsp:Transcript_8855/g.13035  ORF Transcript_8855/g.13035 Transcript_8855/m.13035 type:complete len:227 (-) Transcript_8855:418-1098(-)|eukprot:CAMPEP_0196820734 /NCGR_PEP_ID=MMETSP1362-20130617/76501_1 /TAXON_ID=163516 /ORGANISM="Leptocylindrus danicus, Strain CCMP1856" /LENGTH=226 /DNA_ID=CAMNT_0042199723 /DNA_START=76 /DNA_END=756 /DNA_ORIENTATION=+